MGMDWRWVHGGFIDDDEGGAPVDAGGSLLTDAQKKTKDTSTVISRGRITSERRSGGH